MMHVGTVKSLQYIASITAFSKMFLLMSICTKNLHAQLVHVIFIAYSLQSLTDRNIYKTQL